MKKGAMLNFKLIGYIFLVSVFLNTGVVVPHILTAREFSTEDSFYIIALTIGLGVLIFLVSSVVLYIAGLLFSGMKPIRGFWMLMVVGMIAAVIADRFINTPLAQYNDQTSWIAMIAAFSVMVSLSCYYTAIIGEKEPPVFAD